MGYVYILCALLFHERLMAKSSPLAKTIDNSSNREESLLKQYVKYVIKAYPNECLPPKGKAWVLESQDNTCNGIKCLVPEEWCSVNTDAHSARRKFSCEKLPNTCLIFLDHAILPIKPVNLHSKYQDVLPSESRFRSDSVLLENMVSEHLEEAAEEEKLDEESWKLEFLGQQDGTVLTRRNDLQSSRDGSPTSDLPDNAFLSSLSLPVVPTGQSKQNAFATTPVLETESCEQADNGGNLSNDDSLIEYMFVFGDDDKTLEQLKSSATPTKHDLINTDCLDSHEKCPLWASKDECDRNPFWMLPNCQKSCQSCGMTVGDVNTPTPVEGCFNGDELCQFWATVGECEKNPKWMNVYCQLSCNSCNEKQTA
uniref:ShKT domain-containing protein n=1 Tax=Trichuris muris TaxID=70415 RepID=A0A5S6QGU6_TRIMR